MENNGHQVLFHDLSYIFGTIGTILWTFQLLPQVYKNWRNESTKGRKIVCGISLIFLAIEMLGAAFSALSLAFNPPPFNTYAALLYFAMFTMDLIIFILYYLLNWMHKKNFIDNNNGIDSNLNNDEIAEIIIDDKL
ncbi:9287_t:CDS:2 [Gigaspora margarita]|uniref:9287_t:CDS:1 n=1 Tax=Gigaspora margarita TaxID=4874 RepID=A0ABN7UM39_GIGMA|nr:9287_t:CDS:2 [Gigaspora margarita]